MNAIKRLAAKAFLRIKSAAENYEIEQYKANFAACGKMHALAVIAVCCQSIFMLVTML